MEKLKTNREQFQILCSIMSFAKCHYEKAQTTDKRKQELKKELEIMNEMI